MSRVIPIIFNNYAHVQTAVTVGKAAVVIVQYGLWAWQTWQTIPVYKQPMVEARSMGALQIREGYFGPTIPKKIRRHSV